MTLIVSGVSTLRAIGWSGDFLHTWMSVWLASWLVGFPVLLLALPIAQRIVATICRPA